MPWDPQVHACSSSSRPTWAAPHSIPWDPTSSCLLQFKLSHQGSLGMVCPGTSWFTPALLQPFHQGSPGMAHPEHSCSCLLQLSCQRIPCAVCPRTSWPALAPSMACPGTPWSVLAPTLAIHQNSFDAACPMNPWPAPAPAPAGLPKPPGTCSLHRGCSYTRSLLQDWEK